MVRPRRQGRAGIKLKRKDCGKRERTGDFSSINMYKMEMMPEEEREEAGKMLEGMWS
jgi:hypothetical protein